MKLKLKNLELGAGRPVAFLNPNSAKKMNIHVNDRIEISEKNKKLIAVVDIVKGLVTPEEIALSKEATSYLNEKSNQLVEVSPALEPKSTLYLAKKLKGKTLTSSEISEIVNDIVYNALTEAEIAYFVSAVYEYGMNFNETIALTKAMWKTGRTLSWHSKKIFDKHSIGGIAGNRTTPIIVSICASAGVVMPKTSSRAITSSAGTADVMETITNIDFPPEKLKKIVKKTNACLAWGGTLGLAPADDKLIRVERLLNLDPQAQLIASIMAKKLAAGSTHVLIDIPFGEEAKVSKQEAEKLKKLFIKVGNYFKIQIKVLLTDGSQPIGNGIGPILEMIDVLSVLKRQNPPKDLEEKSLFLAGEILEFAGKAKKGKGKELASSILESGAAYKTFQKIISAQGKKDFSPILAKYKAQIRAQHQGSISSIKNKVINYIGRILGCPLDKSSGIYIHKHKSENIKKGDIILTLYSQSSKKLREALDYLKSNPAFKVY